MKYISFLLTLIAVLLNSCGFNCDSYLINSIKPLHIDGIVIKKKKTETGCFGIIVLKGQNRSDTLKDLCYCVPEKQGLWKYVAIGDSLHKSVKSLIVEVHRKDTVKNFDYPCCAQ